MLILTLFACTTAETEPPAEAPTTEEVAPETEEAAEAPTPDADGWTHYGDTVSGEEVVAVSDLLADPAKYTDQELVVEGRVTEVCQKKACWMVVAHEEKTMRVMMKDHAFSVDYEGAGKDCRVQGTVIGKEVDAELVEHLESETVNKDQMPEAGKEAGSILYQIEATGVAFKG